MPLPDYSGVALETPGDAFWGFPVTPARTRDLTWRWTGELPNSESHRLDVAPPPSSGPDDGGNGSGAGYAFIQQRKGSAHFVGSGPNPLNPPRVQILPAGARALGWGIEVHDGFGGSASYDGAHDYIVPLGTPGTTQSGSNDSTYEATLSITDVATFFTLYFISDGVHGADGDPNWGGPAVGDVNPRAIGIMFYEVAPAGATATATCTLDGPHAGGSASCSTTLPAPWVIASYFVSSEVDAGIFNNKSGSTISATATAIWHDDGERIGPNSALTDTDGAMSCEIDKGSVSATAVAAYAGDATSFSGGAGLSGEPDREFQAIGRLCALDKAYPGSVSLGIVGAPAGVGPLALSPGGSLTFAQRTFDAKSHRGDGSIVTLGTASERAPVRTYLTSTSLAAAGEDPADWVTMIAGRQYPGIRIAHAAQTVLPTPSAASHVYSHDFVAASGHPGNWEGYRFLRIRLKTDAAGETVTIQTDADPSKTYTIATIGTAYRDYDVDLCRPDAPLPDDDPELWDSRFPIRNDGLPHRDPSGWGIGRVRSYTVQGGTNLTLGPSNPVSLVRHAEQAIEDAMPAFLDWELAQTDESYHADGSVGSVEIIQGSRGVVVDVDGRRSIVEPCSLRQLMVDGEGNPLWVYSGRTERNLKATLNACPGFSADESGYSTTDGWHALDGSEGLNWITGGPIFYAGWSGFHEGGGVLWTGSTPGTTLGKAVTGTIAAATVQPRYHEVYCFAPAIGDVWGDSGGAYRVPTKLRVAKILRAAVDGIAYGSVGETVRLRDAAYAVVSSADVPAGFDYRMGPLPYGKGRKDHAVWLGGLTGDFVGDWDDAQSLGEAAATQERWNARRWHRAVFRNPSFGTPTGKFAALSRSRNLVHVWGRPAPDGTLILARANNATPHDYSEEHPKALTPDTLRLEHAKGGQTDPVWVFYCASGGAFLSRCDLGGAPETPMFLGPGTQVVGRWSPNSILFVWRRLSTGEIHCDRYDLRLNPIGLGGTTNLTGFDDEAIDASIAVLDGKLSITFTGLQSGGPVLYTSDDGSTYA